MSSRVCVTGNIKDPLTLIEKCKAPDAPGNISEFAGSP